MADTPAPATSSRLAYVVLFDGMGVWRKGNVVGADVLAAKNIDIEYQITKGAIRPATEFEAAKDHVDLSSPELHLSYEHMLAERDRKIARLTARNSQLEEQLSAGIHLNRQEGITPGQAALIESKDRAIRNLEQRVAQLQATSEALNSELKNLRAQSAADAQLARDRQSEVKSEEVRALEEQIQLEVQLSKQAVAAAEKAPAEPVLKDQVPEPRLSAPAASAPEAPEEPANRRAASRINRAKAGTPAA